MYRLTQNGQRLTLAFYPGLKSLQEIHPQTLKDSTMNWESTRNTPHTRNSHCSSCWTSCFITGRCVYSSIWPAGRAPECSNWLLQHMHTWDAPGSRSTCPHRMLQRWWKGEGTQRYDACLVCVWSPWFNLGTEEKEFRSCCDIQVFLFVLSVVLGTEVQTQIG